MHDASLTPFSPVEYEPILQRVHVVKPSVLANFPAGQAKQVFSWGAYVPYEQKRHWD